MLNKYQNIMEMLDAEPISYNTQVLGAPTSEEELDIIERQIGYKLPEDYREFMRDYAGYTFMGQYPIMEDGESSIRSIDGFVGKDIACSYFATIESVEADPDTKKLYPGLALVRGLSSEVEEIGWPPELLPIGYDGGGNEICLALSGLRPGAIFYWRANPYSNSENLYLLADSFDDFMHLIEKSE